MSSSDESPGRVPDGQPDPVIVGPGMKTLGEGAYLKASNATPSLDVDKQHQTASDAPPYFNKIPGSKDNPVKSPSTPAEAVGEATSGPELLRRLSLVGGMSPISPDVDPRTAYPGLQLSGRIISAAFCIPYKLGYRPGSDWVWRDLSRRDLS